MQRGGIPDGFLGKQTTAAHVYSLNKVGHCLLAFWVTRYVDQLVNVGALSDALNHSWIWERKEELVSEN